MSTSKTIAALLGPTLVATAAMVLVNLETMSSIIEELANSPMLIILAGYGAFAPGLAIVYFHNRWTGGWPICVTLVGWLSLIVGLLRMVFPFQAAALAATIGPAANGVLPIIAIIFAIIFLALGGFLTFKGYERG